MAWSEIQDAQQGRKKVPVRAYLPEDPPRFVLFQTSPQQIPTMWTLYDYNTGILHYIYGEGWDGAMAKADSRITEFLYDEAKALKK